MFLVRLTSDGTVTFELRIADADQAVAAFEEALDSYAISHNEQIDMTRKVMSSLLFQQSVTLLLNNERDALSLGIDNPQTKSNGR